MTFSSRNRIGSKLCLILIVLIAESLRPEATSQDEFEDRTSFQITPGEILPPRSILVPNETPTLFLPGTDLLLVNGTSYIRLIDLEVKPPFEVWRHPLEEAGAIIQPLPEQKLILVGLQRKQKSNCRAIDLLTGEILWEREIGGVDQLVSGVRLTAGGKQFGCVDGQGALNLISLSSGEIAKTVTFPIAINRFEFCLNNEATLLATRVKGSICIGACSSGKIKSVHDTRLGLDAWTEDERRKLGPNVEFVEQPVLSSLALSYNWRFSYRDKQIEATSYTDAEGVFDQILLGPDAGKQIKHSKQFDSKRGLPFVVNGKKVRVVTSPEIEQKGYAQTIEVLEDKSESVRRRAMVRNSINQVSAISNSGEFAIVSQQGFVQNLIRLRALSEQEDVDSLTNSIYWLRFLPGTNRLLAGSSSSIHVIENGVVHSPEIGRLEIYAGLDTSADGKHIAYYSVSNKPVLQFSRRPTRPFIVHDVKVPNAVGAEEKNNNSSISPEFVGLTQNGNAYLTQQFSLNSRFFSDVGVAKVGLIEVDLAAAQARICWTEELAKFGFKKGRVLKPKTIAQLLLPPEYFSNFSFVSCLCGEDRIAIGSDGLLSLVHVESGKVLDQAIVLPYDEIRSMAYAPASETMLLRGKSPNQLVAYEIEKRMIGRTQEYDRSFLELSDRVQGIITPKIVCSPTEELAVLFQEGGLSFIVSATLKLKRFLAGNFTAC